MPTQEEQLGFISDAVLLETQAVIALKDSLTALVNASVAAFAVTIGRVAELDEVENTADKDKIISDLTLLEIAKKQDVLVDGLNLSTVNGISLLSGTPLVVERSATSLVSLNYESRGSLRSPANPLPVKDDSVVIEGLGLFMYVGSTVEPDDDETCFTAKDPVSAAPIGQWLLRVPSFEWQDAHLQLELTPIREWIEQHTTTA